MDREKIIDALYSCELVAIIASVTAGEFDEVYNRLLGYSLFESVDTETLETMYDERDKSHAG